MSVPHPNVVTGIARPAQATRPKRNRSAIKQLLASARDLWDGSSWEPGDDWLTRVDPVQRREPKEW